MKQKKPDVAPKIVKTRERYEKWKIPDQLQKSMRSVPSWPDIKAKVWKKLAREAQVPEEDLKSGSRIYDVIRQFIRNAKNKMKV